jgi:uncharacterized membrane protein
MPARRALKLSVPPLWLIGVCLFLPTVRACEKMESPASLLWGSPPFFSGLLAPYLVAQLLAIVVIVALARGRVTAWATRAVALFVVLSGASAVLLAVSGIDRPCAAEVLWCLLAALSFVAAIVVMLRARALDPWLRLERFVAAFTLMTLPLATFLARILIVDGVHKVGIGAYGFLAAFAALAVVHARALSSRA